jgi:uncharacterized protein (DUF362 family)
MDNLFRRLDDFLKKQISRRNFLKVLFGGFVAFISQNLLIKLAFAKTPTSNGRPKAKIKGDYDLVLAEGSDPYKNTVEAVRKMGGMERFVKKGSTVFIKPNISWDRTPEQAGNTNPHVVAALVDLCYKAGAKRVNVADNTCQEARRCYVTSGIPEAAKKAGAHVYFFDKWNVVKAHFPYESPMEGWPIFRDAVKCDTFINVPILKNHSLTGLTLSMKNLMGVCSGTRGLIHAGISRKLVDLTDFIHPDLTLIDAHRVLLRHGPSGGDLADVAKMNKLIVTTDPTLADAYACTLVDRGPLSLGNVKVAVERGFGSADIAKAKISKIKT